MRLAIFGLVCFWSGLAVIIARVCGWPVIPLAVTIGLVAAVVLILAGALCRASGAEPPEQGPIELQAYFGGTFRMRNPSGGAHFSK